MRSANPGVPGGGRSSEKRRNTSLRFSALVGEQAVRFRSSQAEDLHQANCNVRIRRKTMKVRPLHDRVVVKRLEEKGEVVRGGIVIPDTAKEKPQEGEVVAVGNGKILDNGTRVAMEVKAGDRVLFGKYSGSEIKVDGQEYLIMREAVILGFLAEVAEPVGAGAKKK